MEKQYFQLTINKNSMHLKNTLEVLGDQCEHIKYFKLGLSVLQLQLVVSISLCKMKYRCEKFRTGIQNDCVRPRMTKKKNRQFGRRKNLITKKGLCYKMK